MKIELIRQKFDGVKSYKYKPFQWCCDSIKENPCIVFSTEVYVNDENTLPAFSLWHSEIIKSWEDEWEQDTYYKISHCPFCGEPIDISVVSEEDMNEYYKILSKQREELWKKYIRTDSKKKSEELRKQVQELDDQINWLYKLVEYKNVKLK